MAEAAQARAAFHMQRPAPKGAATWLRPCSDAQSGLLASANDEEEALKLELYWIAKLELYFAPSGGSGPRKKPKANQKPKRRSINICEEGGLSIFSWIPGKIARGFRCFHK